MPILEDGSCAPSHAPLTSSSDRQASVSNYLDGNVSLRAGFVVAIHYPGDAGYESSNVTVYDIASPTSVGGGGQVWMTYYNARWGAGQSGSIADFTRVRLNAPKGWVNGKPFTAAMLKEASYVAFLCVNGRSQQAVIVGLLEHPQLFADNKELGHYWAQQFNGVNSTINKDGEYSITFLGSILDPQTNAYIEPPEATTGTTLVFDKEGSLLLDNVRGESLKLDKKAESLNIGARAMKVDVTDKDYVTTGKGKITFLSQGNAVFNGKKIYIGKEGSSEPLVLGKSLQTALVSMVQAFLSVGVIGKLGNAPVMLSPELAAALYRWKAQYAGPASPFLSKKGFVE